MSKAELEQYLLENKRLYKLGLADLIDYVGVDSNGELWLIVHKAKP